MIISDATGRLLENIVVYNTAHHFKGDTNYRVTKYENGGTEVDMVVLDRSSSNQLARLYEIKLSSKVYPNGQCRQICSNEISDFFSKERGGKSFDIERYVLYTGKGTDVTYNGMLIHYVNIEDYLLGL